LVRGHSVDISGLLAGGRKVMHVEDEVPIESFEGIAFARPASVKLTLQGADGWLEVKGGIEARAAAECDVCLEPVELPLSVEVDERFDAHVDRSRDPFGEANVVTGTRLDVGDLAQQVVLSALPMGVRCPRHSEGTMERGESQVEDSAQ
jgi:uncharacterized metal-binding protein YceD (DUF177 family)